MNGITKKLISLFLLSSMIVSLCGCNGGESQSVVTEESNKVSEGEETITMITWTNDGTIEGLRTLNDMFYKETGIKVELVDVESSYYEVFLKGRIESGAVDIFSYTTDSRAFAQPMVEWAPSEMLTWEKIITDGHALDLSGYDFVKNWSTGAEACRYNDGIYGIATGFTIMNGIFYNKKVFDENGWKEPKTWNEFIDLCEAIKAAGMNPLIAGGADAWPVQMLTNAIVDSVEEDNCQSLSEGLWKGTRTYTDEKSLEVYNREQQILSYMVDDFMNVSYVDAPSLFTEGKAVMFYAGSWNSVDIEAANPDFEYDYFAIPGDSQCRFTGKYDLTFGVDALSPKKEAAVKWLEFFSKPDNYTIFINSNGFVPTMSWISTSNEFLRIIDDRVNDIERTYECYNRVPTNIGQYGTYDLINFSIAGGDFDTPEEFASEAQKEWEAALSTNE